MTVEAWTPSPPYTIAGIGPYTITHPYVQGSIRAFVQLSTGRLALNGTEFSVTPASADTQGDLFLSPTAAATHAGKPLIIDRATPDEQGWLATQGEREAGLAAQLDRMVQSIQELRAATNASLRIREGMDPFDWAEGTVPIFEGGQVRSGPSAAAILLAEANALAAAASATAAAASAAAALAKENSMLAPRGNWATGTDYKPSDIARQGTVLYRCLEPHTSGSFAADLSAGFWELWLQDGAPGPGSGDMLKTENLLGLTDYPLALNRLGGQPANPKLTSLAGLALTAGDLLFASGTTTLDGIPVGADGTVLGRQAGAFAWLTAPQSLAVAAATMGGSTYEYNSVPSWANEIEMQLISAALNAANDWLVQVRVGGSYVTTGYADTVSTDLNSASGNRADGFPIRVSSSGRTLSGIMRLLRVGTSNTWVQKHGFGSNGSAHTGGGHVALSGAIDGIRLNRLTSGTFSGEIAFRFRS